MVRYDKDDKINVVLVIRITPINVQPQSENNYLTANLPSEEMATALMMEE